MLRRIFQLAFIVWTARNIYGLIVIGPVLYRMGQYSTAAAIYTIFCCIAGLALNIGLPLLGWRWLKRKKPQWVL